MKALLYTAPEQYSVTEVPTPTPQHCQVLLRVKACGVCKTDVHIHHGKFFANFPLIPGHEFAGEVVSVGDEVTHCTPGDRVVIDNQRACGVCSFCLRGEPLYCSAMYAQGVNAPGGFAEYALVEEAQVYHLAEQCSFLDATMVEPTACAIHGMDITKPRTGDDILLFGAGPTGLLLTQLLRHSGAALLAVADLSPKKLSLAKKLAQAHTLQVLRDNPQAHIEALQTLRPQGFDVVIDATGVPSVVEQLPKFARMGGRIIYFGVCPEEAQITISPYDVFRRELTIRGSFSQMHTFHRAVAMFNAGLINVEGLITHRFPLEGWSEALHLINEGTENIKIVLTP